jgi:Flp pilus assembly protein TadD
MPRNKKPEEVSEDLDFEIQFLEGVVKTSPDFIEALINLGDLYTKKGFFEKGLAVDVNLSRLRPGDPMILYNLACSYSLVNDLEKAFEVMKKAIQNGYRDIDFLEQDDDLVNLRKFPPFEDFLVKIKTKVLS